MADTTKWLKLLEIMQTLRGENGCPWDKAQTHDTLKKYFLEETYEVLDAIDRRSDEALCDELGDVLLQVVFHAQLAAEQGRFTIDDVLDQINGKMIRRHPHIFADAHADAPEEVLTMWEAIKAKERKDQGKEARGLMQINDNLPALMMAQKVQDKAHRVGFDWPDIEGPRLKLREEVAELEAAQTAVQAEDELGDVLFAAVNLARFYELDAEQALRHTVKKFITRFQHIEKRLQEEGREWSACDLAQLDALWDEAKRMEQVKGEE